MTGLSSDLKYEAVGGPGLVDLSGVLQGSDHPEKDLITLRTAQLLFWLLAAPDSWTQNFNIRVLPQGRYALTRLCGEMSIWLMEGNRPIQFSLEAKMAMAVLSENKHYLFKDIQRRNFNHMSATCLLRVDAEDAIERVSASLPGAVDEVGRKLPTG